MRFIFLDANNRVVSVGTAKQIPAGAIESTTGELGQIMQPDGTFITPEPEPIEPIPSLEEMQMQTLLNTEYLVVMSEISNL